MAAVLSISGRAGNQRLRAKVDAGFEVPARVRLEFPAPGKPIFTYVAVGEDATLLLPREGRVLRHAPPAATLEALAGVAIGPEDLRTIVAGCGFASGDVTRGRAFDRSWLAVDAADHHELAAAVDARGGWPLRAGTSRRAIARLRVGPARHDSPPHVSLDRARWPTDDRLSQFDSTSRSAMPCFTSTFRRTRRR